MVGLRRWAENFDHISVMMPVRDETTPEGWSKPDEGNRLPENMSLDLLPTAYRPDHFLRRYSETRRRIEALIDRNDYLSFLLAGCLAIGALSEVLPPRQRNARLPFGPTVSNPR